MRLFGGTKRGAHPKFRATLTMPPGGANIKAASVALPRSEFLDQGHIKTICTRVQFKENACPAGSIYGTVTAKTPLLDETLIGPLYLRSSDNPLPDIVAAFRGGRIDANIVGRVDSVNGGIRNTFDFVPDVPVLLRPHSISSVARRACWSTAEHLQRHLQGHRQVRCPKRRRVDVAPEAGRQVRQVGQGQEAQALGRWEGFVSPRSL